MYSIGVSDGVLYRTRPNDGRLVSISNSIEKFCIYMCVYQIRGLC